MQWQLDRQCEWILNPASPGLILKAFACGQVRGSSCWSDEDYIGRIARTSRRTNSLRVTYRTITKSLMNYNDEWKKVGPKKLVPKRPKARAR